MADSRYGAIGSSIVLSTSQSVRRNSANTAFEAFTPGIGNGTVTTLSVTTANGVSGSVATATTTPAITLTLGDITPTSIAATTFSGNNTFSANQAFNGNNTFAGTNAFTSLPTSAAVPATGSEFVNKTYVDTFAQGLSIKQSCNVATTANITLSGEQTIDGVLTSTSRVLVKNQTTQKDNGIYISGAGAWSRATDYNQTAEVVAGTFTAIISGSTQSNTQWVQYATAPTIDVDPLLFSQLSTSGSGSVTNVSVATANGFSGTVATSTSTPVITIDVSALDATKIGPGTVSNTEFGYLDGVTSAIQTQLTARPTGSGTANQAAYFTGSTVIASSVDFVFNPATRVFSVGNIGSSKGLFLVPASSQYTLGDTTNFFIGSASASVTTANNFTVQDTSANPWIYIHPSIGFAFGDFASAVDGNYMILDTVTHGITFNKLTGSGSQMVIADATGKLSRQAIPSGLAWSEVTGTSQSMAVNNGYVLNNVALVTATIPSTAAVGDIVKITGKGLGGWKVAQNASQVINFGILPTTTGTGGYLSSTNQYDCVEIQCVTANTTWVVLSSRGNITVN